MSAISGVHSPTVILWTRRPFDRGTRHLITVEVAENENFRRVVAHAQAPVSNAADWTARVLIAGLKPARTYWYRFTDADGNGSGAALRTNARKKADVSALFFVRLRLDGLAWSSSSNASRRW